MFTGLESPWHLLIVLIVAVLVLGPKKLPEAARSLGSGIRQFKDSIEGKDERD
jgi:sec-independent protein translocase protein TatA